MKERYVVQDVIGYIGWILMLFSAFSALCGVKSSRLPRLGKKKTAAQF
jgi:hypothetical protein